MGFEISVDMEIDGFEGAVAEGIENSLPDYLEGEASEGVFECECGSTSFDIEAWKSNSGDIEATGVCLECNEQIQIEVDTSDLDSLK
jgi:hypothetical protein